LYALDFWIVLLCPYTAIEQILAVVLVIASVVGMPWRASAELKRSLFGA
jgi:hypothetical protein